MHNTSVINVLKEYFYIIVSKRNALKKPTSNFKFPLNLSMHVGGEHRRIVRKTLNFQYFKSQKGYYSYKNWCELTTLRLDLYYFKTKSYVKFQLNMSKHVIEKCVKLCIWSILSFRRGITPTKIDGNWWHSNLICSTL